MTLTESSFLESLTFWPEWSTSAWLKRIFELTICQRDTLVLLLLNIFTKNQGFTKGMNYEGPKRKKKQKCFIDLKSSSRFFRTSQMDHHQRLWPHCGWLNNYNTAMSSKWPLSIWQMFLKAAECWRYEGYSDWMTCLVIALKVFSGKKKIN